MSELVNKKEVTPQNFRYIDEEEDGEDSRPTITNPNGYLALPERVQDGVSSVSGCRTLPRGISSEDTTCGFWIFRGPILQKCE